MSRHPLPDVSGPVRTCVGCRVRAAKGELLRVVVGPEGEIVPDPTGTAAGRGAHLHPTAACLEQAERRRAFGRAFKRSVGGAGAVRAFLETLDEPELSDRPNENWSISS